MKKKGKKLTTKQLKAIVAKARTIRENAGSKKVTVKKYNMKWCDAIKRGAQVVLHKPKQKSIRFKK